MDGSEIGWRIRSLLRDQLDMVRVPLGLLPKLDAKSISSDNEFTPGFICSPVTQEHWINAPDPTMLQWRDRLIIKADQILDDRLSYFDLNEVDHGVPFNWHRDFSAGINSPVSLSTQIDYRDFNTYGDCKLVWEPNRHHQFVILARAYVATGDNRYADKVANLMRSWIAANPFGYGMNWKSPLELGVRIINWVWTVDMLRSSGVFDTQLWKEILQSIYLAIWDSQRKFSRGSSANNHLIGEAAGTFIGACYFRGFPNSDHWARKSQAVLEREIHAQTYGDGCTQEHAFSYQFFVIQFFMLCMRAGDAAGFPFSDGFRRRLHTMYRFLHELSADTGLPPNMGDGDNGYVLDLGELPTNAAGLLAVGGHVFEDSDLKDEHASETVFWMTGDIDRGPTIGSRLRKSVSFPESGYHLLRGPRMSVFFDCAALGYGPIAAHGHADCLSICLSVNNQPVIIDPGTYDYFTFPEWRNYFRETRAHNTAEVDGVSQSQMLGPFMWGKRATPHLIEWLDRNRSTVVVGEHDGYKQLPDPVNHRRSLTLDKRKNELTIVDKFTARSHHKIRIHFHLHPACTASGISDTEVEVGLTDARLNISTSDGSLQCIRATDDSKSGWTSNGYHSRQSSTCVRLEREIFGNTSIHTRISLR